MKTRPVPEYGAYAFEHWAFVSWHVHCFYVTLRYPEKVGHKQADRLVYLLERLEHGKEERKQGHKGSTASRRRKRLMAKALETRYKLGEIDLPKNAGL